MCLFRLGLIWYEAKVEICSDYVPSIQLVDKWGGSRRV